MNDVKGVITLSIMAGLGLAVILNADKVSTILSNVGTTWISLIRTVSGTDPSQVKA